MSSKYTVKKHAGCLLYTTALLFFNFDSRYSVRFSCFIIHKDKEGHYFCMNCISVSYKILPIWNQFWRGNNCIGTQRGSFIFRCIIYCCYGALYQILSMLFTIDVYWLQVYILRIKRIENITLRLLMILSLVKKKAFATSVLQAQHYSGDCTSNCTIRLNLLPKTT